MNYLHSVIAIQRVQKLCSQITVRDHALKPNSCCSAWLITESSPKCCWGMHISLNQQQRTLNTVAENTFQTILFRRHLWSTWNVCQQLQSRGTSSQLMVLRVYNVDCKTQLLWIEVKNHKNGTTWTVYSFTSCTVRWMWSRLNCIMKWNIIFE